MASAVLYPATLGKARSRVSAIGNIHDAVIDSIPAVFDCGRTSVTLAFRVSNPWTTKDVVISVRRQCQYDDGNDGEIDMMELSLAYDQSR